MAQIREENIATITRKERGSGGTGGRFPSRDAVAGGCAKNIGGGGAANARDHRVSITSPERRKYDAQRDHERLAAGRAQGRRAGGNIEPVAARHYTVKSQNWVGLAKAVMASDLKRTVSG